MTEVDRKNDWRGEVQILWGIGKPIDLDDGMMFAFTKIQDYMIENSEGWFFRCKNINVEKNPEKLIWENLPEGEFGLKNENFGSVNAEQNIVQLSDGTVYCMYRTISGFPAESYSYDRGESWTLPLIPKYYTGQNIKHPRACPRIWKCENGKYLFWQHNHGGWDFNDRNPVWLSGGIEVDGKILWSQPEVVLYEDDVSKRMSYPDLIQQDGKYWITETNKENGRCHSIPAEFLNTLWSQFELEEVYTEGLVFNKTGDALKQGMEYILPSFESDKLLPGFTIDMVIALTDLTPKQEILQINDESGRELLITTGEFGAIDFKVLKDGELITLASSDPGMIRALGDNSVAISFDSNAKLVQFMINGQINDGGEYRQFGWTRFNREFGSFNESKLVLGKLKTGSFRTPGLVKNLRIYKHPVMNSRLVGNHRLDNRNFNITDLPE